MADMTALEQQWLPALMLLVMAMFISAGLPIAPRWRRTLRIAAIAGFVLALIVALVRIAYWAGGGGL